MYKMVVDTRGYCLSSRATISGYSYIFQNFIVMNQSRLEAFSEELIGDAD